MNGQRRRRYFAAGCSFTIAESRRGDWAVIRTAASFLESKRVLLESKRKCGRLFWPLQTWVVQSGESAPVACALALRHVHEVAWFETRSL